MAKENEFMISNRKQDILIKSVESFIASGDPISSNELVSKYSLKESSATVRNELATLEELGYLKKMHTSGGRVPTSKGYQYFVCSLVNALPKNIDSLKQIKSNFLSRTKYLSELVKDTAKAISDITNYPASILIDGIKNFKVKSIKIAPLASQQAFVLISTDAGIIDPIIISLSFLDDSICKEVSECLTANFKDQTIEYLIKQIKTAGKEISADISNLEEIFNAVANMLEKYILDLETNTFTAGKNKVLSLPEFANSSEAKKLINFMESEDAFKVSSQNEGNISYAIGVNSSGNESENNYSVIKTKCAINGIDLASVAVIGPERMDYMKIASALSFISKEFSNMASTDIISPDKQTGSRSE